MKWRGKEVDALTDDELAEAKTNLDQMYSDLVTKRSTEKFTKLMKNQPTPPINPAFQQLLTEVTQEISKRNENNA